MTLRIWVETDPGHGFWRKWAKVYFDNGTQNMGDRTFGVFILSCDDNLRTSIKMPQVKVQNNSRYAGMKWKHKHLKFVSVSPAAGGWLWLWQIITFFRHDAQHRRLSENYIKDWLESGFVQRRNEEDGNLNGSFLEDPTRPAIGDDLTWLSGEMECSVEKEQ